MIFFFVLFQNPQESEEDIASKASVKVEEEESVHDSSFELVQESVADDALMFDEEMETEHDSSDLHLVLEPSDSEENETKDDDKSVQDGETSMEAEVDDQNREVSMVEDTAMEQQSNVERKGMDDGKSPSEEDRSSEVSQETIFKRKSKDALVVRKHYKVKKSLRWGKKKTPSAGVKKAYRGKGKFKKVTIPSTEAEAAPLGKKAAKKSYGKKATRKRSSPGQGSDKIEASLVEDDAGQNEAAAETSECAEDNSESEDGDGASTSHAVRIISAIDSAQAAKEKLEEIKARREKLSARRKKANCWLKSGKKKKKWWGYKKLEAKMNDSYETCDSTLNESQMEGDQGGEGEKTERDVTQEKIQAAETTSSAEVGLTAPPKEDEMDNEFGSKATSSVKDVPKKTGRKPGPGRKVGRKRFFTVKKKRKLLVKASDVEDSEKVNKSVEKGEQFESPPVEKEEKDQ